MPEAATLVAVPRCCSNYSGRVIHIMMYRPADPIAAAIPSDANDSRYDRAKADSCGLAFCGAGFLDLIRTELSQSVPTACHTRIVIH